MESQTPDEVTQVIPVSEIILAWMEQGSLIAKEDDAKARASEANMRGTAATIFLGDFDEKLADARKTITQF